MKLLRDADWVDNLGPMTRLQLQVRAPTVMHEVTIQQLQRWLDVAPIYTDDKAKLARALNREVSHRSALEGTPEQLSRQSANREISRSESIAHTMAVGSR